MGINFVFALTDYAAFLAITLRLDEVGLVLDSADNATTIREKYFPRFDPEKPNPYVTHSFGVHLMVVTKDRKVIFTQRNDFVAHKRRIFTVAVNEGMQYPQDIDEFGRPSFLKTAIRGIYEELGIDLRTTDSGNQPIQFLNFGALANDNEYSLLAIVKLALTAQEVEDNYHTNAKDGSLETRCELFAVDFIPDEIIEFINTHRPWTGRELAVIFYANVTCYP